MTVDELLADPIGAAELPADAIALHAIVLIEYVNPSSSNAPTRPRLSCHGDEDLTSWTSIGMLRFALQLELDVDSEQDDDE